MAVANERFSDCCPALALVLWIKPDFNQVMRDATQVEQLIVATVNGLKRIILHQNGLPEMQVTHQFYCVCYVCAVVVLKIMFGDRWPLCKFWIRCWPNVATSR